MAEIFKSRETVKLTSEQELQIVALLADNLKKDGTSSHFKVVFGESRIVFKDRDNTVTEALYNIINFTPDKIMKIPALAIKIACGEFGYCAQCDEIEIWKRYGRTGINHLAPIAAYGKCMTIRCLVNMEVLEEFKESFKESIDLLENMSEDSIKEFLNETDSEEEKGVIRFFLDYDEARHRIDLIGGSFWDDDFEYGLAIDGDGLPRCLCTNYGQIKGKSGKECEWREVFSDNPSAIEFYLNLYCNLLETNYYDDEEDGAATLLDRIEKGVDFRNYRL